jgi:hypothetical protein
MAQRQEKDETSNQCQVKRYLVMLYILLVTVLLLHDVNWSQGKPQFKRYNCIKTQKQERNDTKHSKTTTHKK